MHFEEDLASGAIKRRLASGSSETDSEDDADGSDDHKLAKIQHAINIGQPITVILDGQCECNDEYGNFLWQEVQFQQNS
jgi:hypothetical protein